MKRGYAMARVVQYLADTTGEVAHCVSRVSIKCGIGRGQMESIVFDMKQVGIINERRVGNKRVLYIVQK